MFYWLRIYLFIYSFPILLLDIQFLFKVSVPTAGFSPAVLGIKPMASHMLGKHYNWMFFEGAGIQGIKLSHILHPFLSFI